MSAERIDDVARVVAGAFDRRSLAKALGGIALGAAVVAGAPEDTLARKNRERRCKRRCDNKCDNRNKRRLRRRCERRCKNRCERKHRNA